MVIPYTRVTSVSLSRNDRFASRRGFGTPLILTRTAKAGKVDASNLTKFYGSFEEVEADWDAADDFYKQAQTAFGRRPAPLGIKAGYYDSTDIDAAGMSDALDAIALADGDWYQLVIDSALRDDAALSGLLAWVEASSKFALIDSNDELTVDDTDTTSIAAANKGTYERSAVFYHATATTFPAASAAAYMATRNFDQADSAYTLKFKELPGVPADSLSSADVTAATGFTPGVGQSESAGHMANVYVDIGSQNMLLEGSTLTANVFIDEIHASDWIIARTEEEMLGVFTNNPRIPFTDEGMQQLAGAARIVMQQARRAGIVAQDLDPVTGDYQAGFTITVPSVFDVPESQRKARIAPAIQVTFRYAGAVHYSTITYNVTF